MLVLINFVNGFLNPAHNIHGKYLLFGMEVPIIFFYGWTLCLQLLLTLWSKAREFRPLRLVCKTLGILLLLAHIITTTREYVKKLGACTPHAPCPPTDTLPEIKVGDFNWPLVPLLSSCLLAIVNMIVYWKNRSRFNEVAKIAPNPFPCPYRFLILFPY